MSAGANRLASSTTWVDSALFGSQAEESFCWALLSLPASGPATAKTAIQKTRTTHLLQRPHGSPANRRAQLTTPPPPHQRRHPPPRRSPFIATPGWSNEFLMTAISLTPDTPRALLGPLVRHRKHLRRGSAAVDRSTRFLGSVPASTPHARAATADHRRLSWSDRLSLVLPLSKNR